MNKEEIKMKRTEYWSKELSKLKFMLFVSMSEFFVIFGAWNGLISVSESFLMLCWVMTSVPMFYFVFDLSRVMITYERVKFEEETKEGEERLRRKQNQNKDRYK